MKQYHCKNRHPARDRPCGKLLLTGEFTGEVELVCKKCGKLSLVAGTDMVMQGQVDKPVVAMYV
jgi:hypothetical protein